MIIGHHILHGRETKLEKPLALFEKYRTNDGVITSNSFNLSTTTNKTLPNKSMLDSTVVLQNKSKQRTGYRVKAVILRKLIFRSRPKPIIEK